MNCRPKDLAVIVKCPDAPQNIGVIVEVERRSDSCPCGCTDLKPSWLVKTRGRGLLGYGGYFNQAVYATESNVPDEYLRPIRPQADDAVDQMVDQVGAAPKTLTEVLEVSHG